MFPCGASFLVFLTKSILKCPSSTTLLPPCPEKILVAHLHSGIILFCKMLHCKCLTLFWTCVNLSNCSVICTVTCYVLHQTHSEFWHIQLSVFFRYMHTHTYSIIFRVVEPYSHIRHIQAYSGIYSTMCNARIFTTLPYFEA